MPSISKEEIMKDAFHAKIPPANKEYEWSTLKIYEEDFIFPAMDSWAKQVAIGFAAYIGKVLDGEVRIPKNKENHTKWDELFELYLKSIQ